MSKIMAYTIVLVFLLTGCATLPKPPHIVSRGDYSPVKRYISELIQTGMKKDDVTGLSIALVDDQQIVWAKGFGFADENKKIPATAETIYRAGSISKLFTATAIMQLEDRKVLDIDRPLTTYLHDFSIRSRFPQAGPITLREILTHHSGLPAVFLKGMWTPHPEPFENVIQQIKNEYVTSPPNYIFSYSNLGYTLLGCVVERVSGQSFASYMNAAILSPLDMTHSSFSQEADHSLLASRAYRDGKEVTETPLRDTPAGGLNTTAIDLSRFMEMVFAEGRSGKRQIIESRTLSEMLHPQNAGVPLDLDIRIGLGWMLGGTDIHNAGLIASHGGATLCYHSILIVLPELKLGVVVLANSASSGKIVNEVAVETLKLALEAKTGIKQQKEKKNLPKRITISSDKLQSYAGYYDTPVGVAVVKARPDYLQVNAMNKTARLIPRADGRFYLQYKFWGLIPINIGELGHVGVSRALIDGKNILEADVEGRKYPIGERIQPVPISAQWLQRTGKYRCINCGNDAVKIEHVSLRKENHLLLLSYSLPPLLKKRVTIAIRPLSDSEALIDGLGSGRGGTIHLLHRKGKELFEYSGYLFEREK